MHLMRDGSGTRAVPWFGATVVLPVPWFGATVVLPVPWFGA
ncbi:hypothetical protein ABIB25_003800 [Nakamurella sp. UYEF19]